MSVGVIVNPNAGAGRSHPGWCRRLVRDVCQAAGEAGDVRITDGPGSAGRLAREMAETGATTVVAWGGDGTVNEVANVLAGSSVVMGVVPGGSGNGFAHGLGLPRAARGALETALIGVERSIDVGVIGTRLFVNVAGVGFDAHLASAFNRLVTRGPWAYFRVGLREIRSYRASSYTIRAGRCTFQTSAFLITVANGPEYGAGAVIAPTARFDDGVLDMVCVSPRPLPSLLWQARRLFSGTVDRAAGVRMLGAPTMEIAASRPLTFHADGEVFTGGESLQVSVRRSALRVRVSAPRS